MNNLNIIVSGKVMTGNSYLVYEIRRLLRENGWNVEHDYCDINNETEIDLDRSVVNDLSNKIEKIKNNTKVIINEKQLHRNITRTSVNT